MNIWTQRSIDLASQADYLDQLFHVYPLMPEVSRDVDKAKWQQVVDAFETKDDAQLISSLLKLDLFPIKDGYVPHLRKDKSAITRNPQTVSRLASRIYAMGIEQVWARASEPKETNRQMGQLFRRWVMGGALEVPALEAADFLRTAQNSVLAGSDAALKIFATQHLGYTSDKGLDLVAKFNGKYVIGEAKFLTDRGGHQTGQFNDAIHLVTNANVQAITIAVLDGVVYIPHKGLQYDIITSSDANIMSSLVLKDFLLQV